MPLKREELDELVESGSILDKMKPNMFYSMYELSEFMLEKKLPETKEEGLEYISEGKKDDAAQMIHNISKLQGRIALVEALLSVRVMRGELEVGVKNEKLYYCKMI